MEKSQQMDLWRAWMIVLRTPGLGPGGLRERLTAANGDIKAVLDRLRHASARLEPVAAGWLARPDEQRLAADIAWLMEGDHRLLCCTDDDFPPQLEHIAQPPAVLFVSGRVDLLLYPQIAIVGSRNASAAGLAHARAFAHSLGHAGFAITSGLADGIDGAAHRAAMEAHVPTIAVVGTGPDMVYPRKHLELSRCIVASGAMVSEFPPGTAARADHFPRRNRILAGLSLGTLVIEAGLRSGSLITARLAAEQGREVFALPGSIHNPLARGCHRLIREGARLVEESGEIVEALAPAARLLGVELEARLQQDSTDAGAMSGTPDAKQDAAQTMLLRELGHEPATLDELVQRTGCPASIVSSMLMMLELSLRVEALPGNRYQRLPDTKRAR
jgi:DNA processing protein